MAKLKIRTYPDPVLKKTALPVTDFGPVTQKLFDDMIETMHVSDGLGLAAPQIGLSLRIFIACPTLKKGEEFVMVNPVVERSEGQETIAEGCLSLPGISAPVARATAATVNFQDRRGKAHTAETYDLFARVIQHEMDHLNGVLLIDHFSGAKREELLAQYQKTKDTPKA